MVDKTDAYHVDFYLLRYDGFPLRILPDFQCPKMPLDLELDLQSL